MYSLQTRLLRAFGIVIVFFTIASLALLAANTYVVNQYKHVSNSMIAEYKLIDAASRLIDAYNNRFLSSDASQDSANTKVAGIKQEIAGLTTFLDTAIVDKQSISDYEGLKNSIQAVVQEIDAGLVALQSNDLDQAAIHYAEANKKAQFVTQNSSTVIFDELRYAAEIQAQIDKTAQTITVSAYILAPLVLLCMLLYVSRFASQLVQPLKRLTSVASRITAGGMDVSVDDDLRKRQDEIGILAQSTDLMLSKLKQYINEINDEKRSVEHKVDVRTAELREEHARLEASVNSLSLGYIMTDAGFNILILNDVAKSIFAYDIDAMGVSKINKKMLLHRWTIDEIDDLFDSQLNLKNLLHDDKDDALPLTAKEASFNGRELRFLLTRISTDDAAVKQETLGSVIIIEDITDEKVQARSKDEFFSIASHELRTPLTAIRGNSDMLQQFYGTAVKDPDFTEMISDIHESSVRLLDIVNDFLDVSGLEQGKIIFKCESFAINSVAEEVTKDLETFAKSYNNKILLEKSVAESPPIYADKNRIKQVLYNLIGNAMKFTKDGTIKVHAEVTDTHVKVFVADSGQGISEQNQKLLFRKFQQAGDSIYTRDTIKGTGLGLYISKLLTEQMGGRVTLESSYAGKGTTFSFSVPLADDSVK